MADGVSMVSQHALFKSFTRRNRAQLATMTFAGYNDIQSRDLLQVGLNSRIDILIVGALSFAAGATGTINDLWPGNLLRSITLRSNEGTELYRTDGLTNIILQMMRHRGEQVSTHDRFAASTTGKIKLYRQANTGQSMLVTPGISGATVLAPGVTAPTTGTFPIAMRYRIDLATDDDLRSGLLLLQNQSVRATLELQLGQPSDWGFTGTLPTIATAFTAVVVQEYYSVPDDPRAWPELTFVNRTISETVPWTTSGEQVWRVPVSGIVYRLIRQYRSGGTSAQAIMAADDPRSTNFSQVRLTYGGTQTPEQFDARLFLLMQSDLYSQFLPDGTFVYDFYAGGGSVELGYDPRDAYDTSALTEFLVAETTSVTPPANSTIVNTRQELLRRVL
ncbi:MAG: hypothetical protein V2G41_10010 [bacterium JZ-2024 1]